MRHDFYVNGTLKATSFQRVQAAPEHPESESSAEVGLPADNCEYTDPWDNFWSDDCATQQDIDDGVSALVVIEEEADKAVEDFDAALETHCFSNPEDEVCEFLVVHRGGGEQGSDAFAMDVAPNPFAGGGMMEIDLAAFDWTKATYCASGRSGSCFTTGLFASIGVAGWIGTKYGAWAVMTSVVLPPAAAVNWAVFAAVTAGAAAAYGVTAFVQCLHQ
jgi:hypothetical protein